MYELALDHMWNAKPRDLAGWVTRWAMSRYGIAAAMGRGRGSQNTSEAVAATALTRAWLELLYANSDTIFGAISRMFFSSMLPPARVALFAHAYPMLMAFDPMVCPIRMWAPTCKASREGGRERERGGGSESNFRFKAKTIIFCHFGCGDENNVAPP